MHYRAKETMVRATEQLKEENALEWHKMMKDIKESVKAIVMKEIIYS